MNFLINNHFFNPFLPLYPCFATFLNSIRTFFVGLNLLIKNNTFTSKSKFILLLIWNRKYHKQHCSYFNCCMHIQYQVLAPNTFETDTTLFTIAMHSSVDPTGTSSIMYLVQGSTSQCTVCCIQFAWQGGDSFIQKHLWVFSSSDFRRILNMANLAKRITIPS